MMTEKKRRVADRAHHYTPAGNFSAAGESPRCCQSGAVFLLLLHALRSATSSNENENQDPFGC